MSPLFMRLFTLVGIALAAASMHMKVHAGVTAAPHARQVHAAGSDR